MLSKMITKMFKSSSNSRNESASDRDYDGFTESIEVQKNQQEEFKVTKSEIKKRRHLLKYARDARARKEWGSKEFPLLQDDYIPLPESKTSSRAISINDKDQVYSTSSSEGEDSCDLLSEYQQLAELTENNNGKVSQKDFQTISLIGTGSFGKVYLVKKIDTGKLYAMKVLKKSLLRERKMVNYTWSERKILEKVKNPFMVEMKYAFQTSDKLFLILQYCPGGELFFYLQKLGKLKFQPAQFYAANILLALQNLHQSGVIYRDMKPENILIDQDGYAKLTDFGLAKEDMDGKLTNSFCGTTEYLAPEVLIGEGYDFSCDWWSFGCLLYEMLVGCPPFFCKTQEDLLFSILKKEPHYQPKINEAAVDLIKALLAKNPNKRLTDPAKIKQHPFFNGIDWEKLESKEIRPPYKPILKNEVDTAHFDMQQLKKAEMEEPFEEEYEEMSQDEFEGFSYNDSLEMDNSPFN